MATLPPTPMLCGHTSTNLPEQGGQPFPSVVVWGVDPNDSDETDELGEFVRDVLRLHEGQLLVGFPQD